LREFEWFVFGTSGEDAAPELLVRTGEEIVSLEDLMRVLEGLDDG
jgi:hypothetical protein